MSKREKKSTTKQRPRAQGAHRVLREVTEFDPNGVEVTHHRTVDTLTLLLRSGAITPAIHVAARDFQAAFTIACFDSMPRVNLTLMVRLPSTAHHVGDLNDAQLAARERVARALDALGGHGSPAGSCVGTLSACKHQFASGHCGQGGGGRPVRQESAQDILVVALGALAKHYGIRYGGQRRCA